MDIESVYSSAESRVPWMQHNQDRAIKWAVLTGFESQSKPGKIEEEHGAFCRIGMEMMLEHTVLWMSAHPDFKHIGKKMLRMMPEELQEAIDSTSIEPFVTSALPIIRRLYPALFARSLVTIYPITQPKAKVFHLDFQYGTAKAPTAVGDRNDLMANFDSTYGGWGHHYQNAEGDGTTVNFNLDSAETTDLVVIVDGVEKTLTTHYTIGAGAGAGGVDRVVFGTAPASGAHIVFRYGTYSEGDTPRDVDMELTDDDIEAKDIALRCGWTVQTQQDAGAYHSLSIETEMTAAMTNEVDAEIDFNILMHLLSHALMSGAGIVEWSTIGYLPGDTGSSDRRAYEETLADALYEADDAIWSSTKGRARSSWLVAGTSASQWLRKMRAFTPTVVTGDGGGVQGDGVGSVELQRRMLMGTVDTTRMVYKDPRFPTNKILLGYKGPTPLHMGAVYAPYQLFYFTPAMPDPSANFKFKKGVLSRAGMKMIQPEMFAVVELTS